MWRLKQFMPKEPAGLENRTVDISNIKIHIKELLAEGGFSSVYLAQDLLNPSSSNHYALKHVMIQDKESYDLVMKEVSVMKSLKGHPNVVSLVGHAVLDMGRTREAMLLMEFCDKSLVSVLEARGGGSTAYLEEKKAVLIFRDVCNAVFAMHCQSPPMAHRDLKAKNVLLGADGAWKLCDFGSVSTNHKIFDRPEDMGIEEDNIRKHTTPAYRAPEMWDLYRKEVISEKVDIWALGCLLYRILYLKSAFYGESKLQVLNGNYRIPDSPKYSPSIINLIKDMLASSPDARPDITQVWFRVNGLLPMELQKEMPDASPNAPSIDVHQSKSNFFRDEVPKKVQSVPPPRRSPPPPPPPDFIAHYMPKSTVLNSEYDNLNQTTCDRGLVRNIISSEHEAMAPEQPPLTLQENNIPDSAIVPPLPPPPPLPSPPQQLKCESVVPVVPEMTEVRHDNRQPLEEETPDSSNQEMEKFSCSFGDGSSDMLPFETSLPVNQSTDEPPLKKSRNMYETHDQLAEDRQSDDEDPFESVTPEIVPHQYDDMEQVDMEMSDDDTLDRSPADVGPPGSDTRDFESAEEAPPGYGAIDRTSQMKMISHDAFSGMGQMVCGFCKELISYPHGALHVLCTCCQTINLVLQACQVGNITCGQCSVLLMYPFGAPSVRCSCCRYVTEIGVHNMRPPLSVQQGDSYPTLVSIN